jgi:hypothetical protein
MPTHARNMKTSSNGRNGRGSSPPKRANDSRRQPRTLEEALVAAAASGKLAGAARSAIRAQRAAGIPVTYQRRNQVVREHPDGRREVLGRVKPSAYKLPKRIGRIRNG